LLAEREAEFGLDYVHQLVAAVPEPNTAGIVGFIGLLATRRRRS
jgi:hypothetical protein